MKENNKQVIFYSAEKDAFLKSYKDRGNLTKLDGSGFECTERNEVTKDEIKAFLRKIIN